MYDDLFLKRINRGGILLKTRVDDLLVIGRFGQGKLFGFQHPCFIIGQVAYVFVAGCHVKSPPCFYCLILVK